VRRWLVTGIGALMMAASVFGFARYAERTEAEVALVEAILPTRLVASGETIDAGILRRVKVPEAAVPSDALRDEASIVGMTAVAPIGPNETFADWKLAPRQLTPRDGERYVSFPTDDVTNVGNMLRRGDRVDVWVEFERPVPIGGVPKGAMKVIEGVLLASVRSPEGGEVADAPAYDAPFQPISKQRERVRASANGHPAMNTFIMDEASYEAYALAAIVGTIKLTLPEPSSFADGKPSVTEEFIEYRSMLASEGGERS